MRVLSINTYGGSLLLGASALGLDIVGSYEDSGFGLPIQQANFPHLNFVARRKDWPSRDLSETFVIAHPPCSAFSTQNTVASKRGVDSDAFACTISVLRYAMENKAFGIAVESVMGALPGAYSIHQSFARDYGYHVYRIIQNGCMFSAQWRERFWVVYLRKGLALAEFPLTLTPKWMKVKDVVTGYEDGPSAGNLDRLLERQRERLIDEAHCSADDLDFLFKPHDHGRVPLGKVLWKYKFPRESLPVVFKKYISGFASGTLNYLSPESTAPVLMGGSWWYYNGRNLSESAYKRLMGFPANYLFPERPRNFRKDLRTYLSKGVIPQVATWVLEQVGRHVGAIYPEVLTAEEKPYVILARPNMVADFRISRKGYGEERPPLRFASEYQPILGEPDHPIVGEESERANELPESSGRGGVSSQV